MGKPASARLQLERRRLGAERRLAASALLALAAAWVAAFVAVAWASGHAGWDLRYAYLPAARAVLDGESPYPRVDDQILEDQKGYVYPPQLALALVPLTSVPEGVAAAVSVLALLGLAALTLYVVGVCDPRCYAAALASLPVLGASSFANLSVPLALALALAWRYRERPLRVGVALGLAVSAKLVLWPMLVWSLASRRWRATALGAAIAAATTLAAWALIGFRGALEYPALLRRLSEIQSENSYSLLGVAATVGLPAPVGRAALLALGGALLVACLVFARRGDDARAFTCAVTASLALSPIVWMHYLVALFVPLAIARPRFGWPWLLPLLLWLSPRPGYADGLQALVPTLVVSALVAALLARPVPVPRPSRA